MYDVADNTGLTTKMIILIREVQIGLVIISNSCNLTKIWNLSIPCNIRGYTNIRDTFLLGGGGYVLQNVT